mmetsp:Transcript_10285/g.14878  ORF Transcript_10285/g.14878 Transcript_10285/m.14878 type:complete len:212 (-) Transcript_10285:631-1266(-)
MLQNFSSPMSAPKPASVSTYPSGPTIFIAIWSATTEEFPCAMFANGPACTNTGVPSKVCMRFGIIASFISTVSAPPTPRSSAVTGSPRVEKPTIIAPRRSLISLMPVESAKIAMISEATVMSKPVSRILPFSVVFKPTVIFRRNRSFTSTTRCSLILDGSMSKRTNLLISASVSSLGSVFSIASFFSLRNITGANLRDPSAAGGQSLLNSA